LQEFTSFLAQKRTSHITVAVALELATRHAHQKPAVWAARLSIVRGFARHWSATDPSTEVPPLGLLPYRPARAQPYFIPTRKSGSCWEPPRLDRALIRCVAGPTTVYSDYWPLRACDWEKR
jgi:hypothetical protein